MYITLLSDQAQGTGCEKPLTSGQKRIVGSSNRKSRDLRWETADECEKRIVGSRWGKTAEKTRAQSSKSNFLNVGDPYMAHIWI